LENRKKFTSTKFLADFAGGGPVNYRLIMGRSWADESDIKGFLYFNKQIKNKEMKKIYKTKLKKFKK
jgi:hypothetical protein